MLSLPLMNLLQSSLSSLLGFLFLFPDSPILAICIPSRSDNSHAFFVPLFSWDNPDEAPIGRSVISDFVCSRVKRFGFDEIATSYTPSSPKTLKGKV